MKAIGIIPARLSSTRLPEKPLVDILGKPLIQWTYEQAKKADSLEDVVVATDEQRILEVVEGFGGKAVLTSRKPISGTERVAEATFSLELEAEIIVNIQVDEPLLDPFSIDKLIRVFYNYNNKIEVATLIYPIQRKEELEDPNIVKVVVDKDNFALYFSRSSIPYSFSRQEVVSYSYKHIGVYAYRRDFLSLFVHLPSFELEKKERLEQLRVLENGYRIKTVFSQNDSISVDTQEDLNRVRDFLLKKADKK
ncbi:MAG: 3-deoxy-manno-octulosonate cytidylyltransferase [Candidatus Omnitrophota bacterium]|nr:MAG: 3-deoxy-manno-octulosonate cytidylyltransferase [Candidatus Omnitrophota bacterium]